MIDIEAWKACEGLLKTLAMQARGTILVDTSDDVLHQLEVFHTWVATQALPDTEKEWGVYFSHPYYFKTKKECFEYCLSYGLVDAVKWFSDKCPELLTATYGTKNEKVTDFVFRILSELEATELAYTRQLKTYRIQLETIFEHFVKTKKIPLSAKVVESKDATALTPKESVENKACLLSVQDSIEKLLKHYKYMEAGACNPASAYLPALKAWIKSLQRKPVYGAAVISFTAMLNAKTELTKYEEMTPGDRKGLYGLYRFTVRDTKQQFTMQDVFALVWQALHDEEEITKEQRQGLLESWIDAMNGVMTAYEPGHNPLVSFEGETYGCANAMIVPTVTLLTNYHPCVRFNYANTTSMELKAFNDFVSTFIETHWKDNLALQEAVKKWVQDTDQGMPDTVFTPELQLYVREQLKKEYVDVVTDLDAEINKVLSCLPYRSTLPRRVLRLYMQLCIEEHNTSVPFSIKELQETRLVLAAKKLVGAVVQKIHKWHACLASLRLQLLPINSNTADETAYLTLEMQAMQSYLLQRLGPPLPPAPPPIRSGRSARPGHHKI